MKLKISGDSLAHEEIAETLLEEAGVLDALPIDELKVLDYLGLRQLSFNFGDEPDFVQHAPKIPEEFLDSKYVFLANTHPALQQEMLASLKGPRLVVADTMNLWINTERHELVKLLGKIHGLVLNDGEARLLTEKKNLIEAARETAAAGSKRDGFAVAGSGMRITGRQNDRQRRGRAQGHQCVLRKWAKPCHPEWPGCLRPHTVG